MKALPYMLIFVWVIGLMSCNGSSGNSLKFNADTWLKGDWRTRGKMVGSIIKDSVLIGRSKPEVLAMLGEPTASDTTSPLVYIVDIGEKVGPFGIGGVWLFYLTIRFDTTDSKVTEVRYGD